MKVFCREKPPVGGISVKEHFEINVVPITIAITKKFYTTMLKFCFPDRDTSAYVEEIDDAKPSTSKKSSKSKKHSKDSSFYVKIEKDDAEIVSFYFKFFLTQLFFDYFHFNSTDARARQAKQAFYLHQDSPGKFYSKLS